MTREMSSKSSAKKNKRVPGAARHAAGGGKTARSSTTPAAGDRLPIVGLGASAGGLEALKGFLGAMPAKTGRLSMSAEARETSLRDVGDVARRSRVSSRRWTAWRS
jgi:hypothetical protein